VAGAFLEAGRCNLRHERKDAHDGQISPTKEMSKLRLSKGGKILRGLPASDGQRLSGRDIDNARVSDGYCSRFCSSQIAEVAHTLREELAVDLIVGGPFL